jgi:hypothetical protein
VVRTEVCVGIGVSYDLDQRTGEEARANGKHFDEINTFADDRTESLTTLSEPV